MNRRAFLQLAGMTAAAGVALVMVPSEALSVIDYRSFPTGARELDVTTFQEMTRRVAARMRASIGQVPHVVRGISRIDQEVEYDDGRTGRLTDHFTVFELDNGEGIELREGASITADEMDGWGDTLTDLFRSSQMSTSGTLLLPPGVGEACNVSHDHGPIVRGLMVYDVYKGAMVMRFDLIGERRAA